MLPKTTGHFGSSNQFSGNAVYQDSAGVPHEIVLFSTAQSFESMRDGRKLVYRIAEGPHAWLVEDDMHLRICCGADRVADCAVERTTL
jgi:hypothetical protein